MNIYIPAGGSAHSITVSARAVSLFHQSRYHTIFLTFIGSVLCIKCPLALAALFLLSSGMLRLLQRPLRFLVFSKTYLAFSGVRGSAVGRNDDIITTTHTYTATVEATNHHVIMSLSRAVDQATPIPSHIHLPAILVAILWGAWPIATSLQYMLQ